MGHPLTESVAAPPGDKRPGEGACLQQPLPRHTTAGAAHHGFPGVCIESVSQCWGDGSLGARRRGRGPQPSWKQLRCPCRPWKRMLLHPSVWDLWYFQTSIYMHSCQYAAERKKPVARTLPAMDTISVMCILDSPI
jgi:hypothetical protein